LSWQADQSAYRSDIENCAASRLHHHEHRRADEVERTGQIGPKHLLPVLLGHHYDDLVASEPALVDQPVDPPQFLLHRVYYRATRLEIANIALEREGLDAEAFNFSGQRFSGCFTLDEIEGDIGAAPRAFERNGSANTAGRARNDYPLAFEVFHIYLRHPP